MPSNEIKGDETMAKKETTRAELKKQEEEILRQAEESGVHTNYFFRATFKQFQVKLGILDDLEKTIDEEGMTVSKEYVKGRKNLYINPAIAEYNRTSDSANKTVSTLMKIIKTFGDDEGDDKDPLLSMINGENE
jgi:flagellin-like hook-associated protein FlgL